MAPKPVEVEGLADMRRTLRQTDKAALKEVQKVTKRAAEIVALDARQLAPRKTGKLAKSIKPGTRGNDGVVRSRLPYAKVHEWGGTIRPRGVPIKIKRSEFVGRAMQRKEGKVRAELERGYAEVMRRSGLT